MRFKVCVHVFMSSLLFFVSRQESQNTCSYSCSGSQRQCLANEYKKAQIQTSAPVSVPRRRILNTQVFYHHKGRMSRKQAAQLATNCPSKGKKSEKKVKLAERASSHTCKMCKRGRVDARRQACPLAAYRMGSVYLFHAKRVTIHTLPRASELCAGDAKSRTRYNLP